MRVEQKNMFTGQFDVIRDDAAEAKKEARWHMLSMLPFECDACDFIIDPEWGKHYDEDEDKVYRYYHHYCHRCGFEQYVDWDDNDITDIIRKREIREQAYEEYKKLYDRRLL